MRDYPLVLILLLAAGSAALATPLRCDDPCIVETSYAGYMPALVEVASGGTVVWRSVGGGHFQADHGTSPECFVTGVEGGQDSDPARFDLAGGVLTATTQAFGTVECGNAVALPDGSVALPYECTIHPNMQGMVVVAPA